MISPLKFRRGNSLPAARSYHYLCERRRCAGANVNIMPALDDDRDDRVDTSHRGADDSDEPTSVNIMPEPDDDRDDRVDTSHRRADDSDEDDIESIKSIEQPPPKCFGKSPSGGEYRIVMTNDFGTDCCPANLYWFNTPFGCLFVLVQVSHRANLLHPPPPVHTRRDPAASPTQLCVVLIILAAAYTAHAHCSARGADDGVGPWKLTPSSAWALAAPRAQRSLPVGWDLVIGRAANSSTEYLANRTTATADRICDAVLLDMHNGTLARVASTWNRTVASRLYP